ncbi:MAG: SoxR reducing system RseC family protein [Eubacteriales bacterium]|nr:SoxR reducing system RseC family protein [Eubacteriales bacterium]
MIKIAQVVNIENNLAYIKVARASACGDNCASCGSACTDKGHILKVADNGYAPGQLLTLTTKDKNLLAYSSVAYGIPLLVMLAATLLSYRYINIGNKDIVSAVSGLLSLVLSFYILRQLDRFIFKDSDIIESIVPYRGES